MNTRRKMLQGRPVKPSTHWHIMDEAYHVMFIPESREHVEYWYNMGATGVQRDLFRGICSEIYTEDPNKPDPTFPTLLATHSQMIEADLLIKNYGRLLTDLGKAKARVWILYNTNHRHRDKFRDVFTGCQTVFEKRSVMHTDFTPFDAEAYDCDRTYFQRSVDWTSLNARDEMQKLQQQQQQQRGHEVAFVDKRPSAIYTERNKHERFTKPKNQFDGVNPLVALGYGDVPLEEAVAALKAKRDTHQQVEQYYVDADGSTVYKAAAKRNKRTENSTQGGGILASVTSDPMAQWKVKTCD